ncbi:MAG: hypothetical protein WB439_14770 [Acidobacteriaceae bacterium]
MSEITDLLEQKAGLSPDKAQEVEQIVLQHIGSRIPPQFQGMFNSLLGGGAAQADGQPTESGGGLGSLLGEASSFFGNK